MLSPSRQYDNSSPRWRILSSLNGGKFYKILNFLFVEVNWIFSYLASADLGRFEFSPKALGKYKEC